MSDELSNLGDDLSQRVAVLYRTAHEYYQLSEVLEAAQVFRKTLQLAEAINDPSLIVNCRRWCGAALYEGGKLREALAVLVPIIRESNSGGDSEDSYVAMIKYVEIAQEIPVSASAIRKAHSILQNTLTDAGNLSWRHMQVKKLSEFYKLRGLYAEALDSAQESWHLFSGSQSGPSFLAEEYLYNLLHLYLLNQKVIDARRLLSIWDSQVSQVPSYGEMTKLIRQSEVSRVVGEAFEAISAARKAYLLAQQTRHYWRLNCSLHALARAFICAHKFRYAEGILRRLAETRHSESLHNRYKFHLLRGDFYLAYARQETRGATFDDEFGIELSGLKSKTAKGKEIERESYPEDLDGPPSHPTGRRLDSLRSDLSQGDEPSIEGSDDTGFTQWEDRPIEVPVQVRIASPLAHAEQAYRTAMIVGTQIDSLLDCHLRQSEVGCRFERLRDINHIERV